MLTEIETEPPLRRIAVVDDTQDADRRGVVAATDYLLSGAYSAAVCLELRNDCTSAGMFSARAYVDSFALARGHDGGRVKPPKLGLPSVHGPLGVLYTPDLPRSPSLPGTLRHFESIAIDRGVEILWLRKDEIDAVDSVGALFVRDNTSSTNHTLAFASRAVAGGIPVIDAPEVILACADKALQAEIFAVNGLPTPGTRLMHAGNVDEVVATLGYPFVLKQVDGCWSREVWRIDGAADLALRLPPLLARGFFAVAQVYRPTSFDWRIAVLDGELLFAARYHTVPGHWQVALWDGDVVIESGRTEPVSIAAVPIAVANLARVAARAFGAGLLGVDLKDTEEGLLVIEVNDCVDLDVGFEDGAEGSRVYHRLLDALGYR